MRSNAVLLLALICVWPYPAVGAAEEDRYEFRGRLEIPKDWSFRDGPPVVFLHGTNRPFMSTTRGDFSGKFRFKDLRPGAYMLVIALPLRGEMRQTVQISPSFADSKRRVELTFAFDAESSRKLENTVSAARLLVPGKAEREYRNAQKRLEKEDIDGAVEHLEKAVEAAPSFAAAWNFLGTIAYQRREFRNAESHFREALKHEPGLYPPLVNLGGTLLSQGRLEEALELNLEAVRVRPDDALAHAQLGKNYYHLGQMEEAERHLRQSKALDPGHFSYPQLVLASLYALRGDDPAAAAELREFLEHHPDSEESIRARVQLKHLSPSSSSQAAP